MNNFHKKQMMLDDRKYSFPDYYPYSSLRITSILTQYNGNPGLILNIIMYMFLLSIR